MKINSKSSTLRERIKMADYKKTSRLDKILGLKV